MAIKRTKWHPEREQKLVALAKAGKKTQTIANILRVSNQAIRSKAMRLGVQLGQ